MGLSVGPLSAIVGSPAQAAQDPRETKGRALFAKGDYQAALDIYANLFAEHADPLFLRNIGRCYQKLRQADKAIDSFREYLRRSPRVKPSEREEINGFIREMEAVKSSERVEPVVTSPPAAHPSPPAPEATTAAPRPIAANLEPRSDVAMEGAQPAHPPHVIATDALPAENPPAEKSIVKRWWFWAGVGAVLAGAATAFALSRDGQQPCPTGYTCR
jgi:tetratricopeptide (TPR) repeat protein